MAISGDLKVLAGAFAPRPKQALRHALHPLSPSSSSSSAAVPAPSKARFGGIHGVRCNHLDAPSKFPKEIRDRTRQRGPHCSASRRNSIFPAGADPETEGFLRNAARMNLFERLSLAWRILFPTVAAGRSSNANVAKQRLKMILFSDRCAVSDEAKRKIVGNIVSALSDFVEIDSEDKVQLSVSADPDLGTVYSVTVPVRRVKPEFRGGGEEYRGITNVDFKDTGEESGTVDVRFDFFVPGEKESESSVRF